MLEDTWSLKVGEHDQELMLAIQKGIRNAINIKISICGVERELVLANLAVDQPVQMLERLGTRLDVTASPLKIECGGWVDECDL